MKLQYIFKTQVDIFSSVSRSGKIYYTQTLYYFLTKLAEKNKKQINIRFSKIKHRLIFENQQINIIYLF